MSERIYLDRDWTFTEEYKDDYINSPIEEGKNVNIPHTCKETPFNYFDEHEYQMVSCYQKLFKAEDFWSGKRVLLTFDAVGHEADVYINGTHVANHKCGYTAFTIDISKNLRYGAANLITVRVDSNENINQPPFGFVIDYMTYGGIYRDVYLDIKEDVYLKDVFLQPKAMHLKTTGMSAEEIAAIRTMATLKTELTLSEAGERELDDGRLAINQYIDEKQVLGNARLNKPEITTSVSEVALWDVESPKTYTVVTELLLDGEIIDMHKATVGFRDSEFREDGYYLNGRKFRIRGVNRHQSFPYVGYAMPESMQRHDARILKNELGVNAVRTSHYPQSHYFIDECDKLGLLVFTEIPGWQHIGDKNWQDLAVENVEAMVKQYRNHPSIIIWGVRINESQDNDEFYAKTNAKAHELDPTRQTGGVRCNMAGKDTNIQEDVFTYNDFVHSGQNEGCSTKEKATHKSTKPYLVTEYNGHMYPTKTFDAEEHRVEHMLRHANVLDAIAGGENISGSFGWCMFDYNTHKDFGSGDRICYHGIMDMFRNPKLAASVYAAEGLKDTVLEVSSSMDIGEHPACNRGDTFIISNADSVRMYKNDDLLKEYFPENTKYKNLTHGPILIDEYVGGVIQEKEGYDKHKADLVRYVLNQYSMGGGKITPGIVWAAVRLVAFHGLKVSDAIPLYQKYIGDWGGESKQYRFEAIKDGKVVKSVVRGAATAVKLQCNASSTELFEDQTYDVAEIRIKAVDQNGNVLPFFAEPVHIVTEGPVEVIGPDVIPLRGGMTGTYIKTTGIEGNAVVRVVTSQAEPVVIEFNISNMN